jgi:DNA polymerase-3 subunit delta
MLYAFFGSDTLSVRESIQALKEKLNPDGALETNTFTFSASEASPEQVIAACDTVPFLGAHRLVILEGALRPGRSGRKAKLEAEDSGASEPAGAWGALVEYVPRMPESTVLVLVDGDKVNEGLVKSLRPLGDVQRSDTPPQKAIGDWVKKRAKTAEVQLGPGAAAAIAELVGDDTWAIATELEKLRDYADGRPITVEDVRLMVAPSRETPPWDLLDPIADGKGASALKALRKMLELRHPLVIAAIIQGTYRQLASAREMIDAGASGREVGERLGLRGYPLEKLLDRAARFTPGMVREAYARIVQADADIKLGVFEDELSLELLVTDLAVAAAAKNRAA